MENKINIAELLKDCPEGMELDCTMYDNVRLDSVSSDSDYPIKIGTENGFFTRLTRYGQNVRIKDAKCVIFPKGKTTWEGFVPPCKFKDGDILITAHGNPFILKDIDNNKICESYCGIRQNGEFVIGSTHWTSNYDLRFATEEEKEKLFKAIKDNGYKWNAETKTLEKLPKFKEGDRIRHKCEKFRDERTIISYGKSGYWTSINDWIDYKNQDDWELVPKKFDITTLKPFSEVLVRYDNDNPWMIAHFSHYMKDVEWECPYFASGACFKQCIPYKGNEHLRGTTNDCDDFYKTWK